MSWTNGGDARRVFKIISELVRSRTFAAGRYMQWLIATGSIAQDLDISLVRYFPHRLSYFVDSRISLPRGPFD